MSADLIAAVDGKLDVVLGVAVYDPFNKVQVRPHECELPLPTTKHRASFMQSREYERLLITEKNSYNDTSM